jgi:hypothetical protein
MREFAQRLIDGQPQLDPVQLAAAADSAVAGRLSNSAPMGEAVTPTAGSGQGLTRDTHQHPRLTSVSYGVVISGNTATVNFTRAFDNKPGLDCLEENVSVAGAAQPAIFGVSSWVQDGNGKYTGVVIRVWRAQTVPQNLVSMLVSAVFNIFGASVTGTSFSCIAVARSDV